MNWLALQVSLPYVTLLGGALVLMLAVAVKRSHLVAAILTGVTLLATFATQFVSWPLIYAGGVEVLHITQVDALALFFNTLFLAGAALTAILAYPVIQRLQHREEFYLLLLTATLGAMVMAAASHFVTFILGLEVLSVSLYALIAYPEKVRPPLEAAIKYLILSGVASTTILFGMALAYAATGSLTFDGVVLDATASAFNAFVMGQLFIWVGLAFKLSLVPFHQWTPDVYQGAPAVVTGYIATVSKAAVFALVVRYVVTTDILSLTAINVVLTAIAVLSMVGGNILALMQRNLKRLLAYSSIAHVGYLLIAILLLAAPQVPAIALETVMLYLAAYFVITLAAFGIVSNVSIGQESRAERLDFYTGLYWRQPLLAAVLTTVALSLAGIPITVGFIAKFYLFAAGVEGQLWLLVWALIVGSAIGVFYYLRIIFAMVKPVEEEPPAISVPYWPATAAVLALGVAMVFFGVYPAPLIDLVNVVIHVANLS